VSAVVTRVNIFISVDSILENVSGNSENTLTELSLLFTYAADTTRVPRLRYNGHARHLYGPAAYRRSPVRLYRVYIKIDAPN